MERTMMMQETVTTNKKAYSVKEVSELTSLSTPFVRLEIKRGNLKAAKFGARVLVTDKSLSEYLEKGEENEK